MDAPRGRLSACLITCNLSSEDCDSIGSSCSCCEDDSLIGVVEHRGVLGCGIRLRFVGSTNARHDGDDSSTVSNARLAAA